jgi:hypothetical protein
MKGVNESMESNQSFQKSMHQLFAERLKVVKSIMADAVSADDIHKMLSNSEYSTIISIADNYLTVNQVGVASNQQCPCCKRVFFYEGHCKYERKRAPVRTCNKHKQKYEVCGESGKCHLNSALCAYNNSVDTHGDLVRCKNGASGIGAGSYCSEHKAVTRNTSLFCCMRCRIIKCTSQLSSATDAHYCSRCDHIATTVRQCMGRFVSTITGVKRHRLEMTAEQMVTRFTEANGLCEYTSLKLAYRDSYKREPFFISIERRDQNQPYTSENVIFVICQMNGRRQWTKEKLMWCTALRYTPELYVNSSVRYCTDLEALVGSSLIKHQLDQQFSAIAYRFQTDKNNPKKYVRESFDVERSDLDVLFVAQRGRCAISSVPFAASHHKWWMISVDRKNDNISYQLNNIQLVCNEFNTNAKWTSDLAPIIFDGIRDKLLAEYSNIDNITQACSMMDLDDDKLYSKDRRSGAGINKNTNFIKNVVIG